MKFAIRSVEDKSRRFVGKWSSVSQEIKHFKVFIDGLIVDRQDVIIKAYMN